MPLLKPLEVQPFILCLTQVHTRLEKLYMLTVDITDLPEADIGSRVVLWGEDAANGTRLSIDEVARHCDTVSYTLLTGILPRVSRRYRQL